MSCSYNIFMMRYMRRINTFLGTRVIYYEAELAHKCLCIYTRRTRSLRYRLAHILIRCFLAKPYDFILLSHSLVWLVLLLYITRSRRNIHTARAHSGIDCTRNLFEITDIIARIYMRPRWNDIRPLMHGILSSQRKSQRVAWKFQRNRISGLKFSSADEPGVSVRKILSPLS